MKTGWLPYLAALLIGGLTACGTGTPRSEAESDSVITETITLSGSISGSETVSKLLLIESTRNEAEVLSLSSGAFSEEIETGEYAIAALDSNDAPVAVLVQDGASVFTLSASVNLGAMTVDTDAATLESSTSLTAATSSLAVGKSTASSVDLTDLSGIGSDDNDNGLTVTQILDDTSGDSDGDLVPDFLDNDNNEDGIFDSVEGLQPCLRKIVPAAGSSEGLTDLDSVECLVFDNLKLNATQLLNGDGDSQPHTGSHILAYHVTVPSTLVSLIQSVEVDSVPTFADGTISPAAGTFTFTSYPTAGDAWSTHGYELPHATNAAGDDVYSVWVNAADDPHPSIFTYKITLTTGTVAYFRTRLFFVFHTPPKITSIADGAVTTTLSYPISEGGAGTQSNPLQITGAGPLVFTADRPLFRAGGHEVCGMNLQAHIFYLDASGNELNTAAVETTATADSGACDPTVNLTLSLDLATDLPTTYSGQPVSSYQIDFTVRGANGDNGAEKVWVRY